MTRRQIFFQLMTCIVLLIGIQPIQANNDVDTIPAQITFIYPIGTNGTNAGNVINNISINVFYGMSAGVHGAEFGGFLNYTKGPVMGGQFAGFANIGATQLKGAQFAGFINTSSSSIKGVQAAGFINIASNSSETNVAKSGGAQLAGFLNINANKYTGMQSAGFLNVQTDSLEGMQMAGFMNLSTNYVQGVQLSGFLNKAKHVKGTQIGVINIADSIENGVALGLINIVKNGYRTTEVETNENFYTNASYKMGVKRLYTIFSIGFKSQNNEQIWAPGFGVGTHFDIGSKGGFNIDAICYHVNEDEWWTNELNELNKLKFNGSYQLFKHLSIYGGVSLNVLVSKVKNDEGMPGGSMIEMPSTFYNEINKKTHVAIFPGWNVGFRF